MRDGTAAPVEGTRRILVLGAEMLEEPALHEALRFRARGACVEALVVSPVLDTSLRIWTSDDAAARRAAEARLAACLDRLAGTGIEALGRVGDPDPLLALADALALFPADEVIVGVQAGARSHPLGDELVEQARARFGLPVHAVAQPEPRRPRPGGRPKPRLAPSPDAA